MVAGSESHLVSKLHGPTASWNPRSLRRTKELENKEAHHFTLNAFYQASYHGSFSPSLSPSLSLSFSLYCFLSPFLSPCLSLSPFLSLSLSVSSAGCLSLRGQCGLSQHEWCPLEPDCLIVKACRKTRPSFWKNMALPQHNPAPSRQPVRHALYGASTQYNTGNIRWGQSNDKPTDQTRTWNTMVGQENISTNERSVEGIVGW